MTIKCTKCGSYKVTPSGKRGLSKIFGHFPFVAFYRCKDCWVRFWTFKNPFQSIFSKIMAGVIGVLFVALYVLSAVHQDLIPDGPGDSRMNLTPSGIRQKIKPVLEEKTNQKTAEAQNVQPAVSKTIDSGLKKPDEISPKTQFKPADREEKQVRLLLAKERVPFNLRGIETQNLKREFRVVLLADHAIKKYETFLLDSPSRLVVDLPGKWKNLGYSEFKLNTAKVSRIRVGEHPDKLRIVFDLTHQKPAAPILKESNRGLILILK